MRHPLKIAGLAASSAWLASPALAATTAASPHHLSIGDVFGHAAPLVQVIALILLATIIAAPTMLALGRGAKLDALAKGAPLLALAAGLFTLLAASVGIANSPVVPSLTVLAPAFAESLLLLILGALATFAAVVCRELAKPRTPA